MILTKLVLNELLPKFSVALIESFAIPLSKDQGVRSTTE